MKINEVIIDNKNGAGATPNNMIVDYKGLRVLMKPSVFLSLAAYVTRFSDRVENMRDFIKAGNAIGSPFLIIDIPKGWETGDYTVPAHVYGHEGRHRMLGVLQVEGNTPIETHLFFGGYNRERLKPEWIELINQSMISEDGDSVKGPLFELIPR